MDNFTLTVFFYLGVRSVSKLIAFLIYSKTHVSAAAAPTAAPYPSFKELPMPIVGNPVIAQRSASQSFQPIAHQQAL